MKKSENNQNRILTVAFVMIFPSLMACGMPMTPAELKAHSEQTAQIKELVLICAEPVLEEQIDDSDGSWMKDRVRAWRLHEKHPELYPSIVTQEFFADFLERTTASGLPGIKVNRERCSEATIRSPAIHSNVIFTDEEVEEFKPR